MVVMRYANDIIKYDRSTPELSNVALHMTQDATSIDKFKVRLTSS